ncbi:hypothetical protein D3C80_1487230 [compost metagenome]
MNKRTDQRFDRLRDPPGNIPRHLDRVFRQRTDPMRRVPVIGMRRQLGFEQWFERRDIHLADTTTQCENFERVDRGLEFGNGKAKSHQRMFHQADDRHGIARPKSRLQKQLGQRSLRRAGKRRTG